MNDLALSYRHKAESYFQGARKDLIDQLSAGSHRILEIGCGAGGTGAYAKATGKAAFYHGVELVPDYGKIAKDVLDKVTIGNVEDLEITDGPYV